MDGMRAEKAHAASLSGGSEARLSLVVIGDHVWDATLRSGPGLLAGGDASGGDVSDEGADRYLLIGHTLSIGRLPGGVA